MAALGETFRKARESQGLTLADVAERIHIRDVYLTAIEAENWSAIGPAVYVRGFVRTYARCLGLDADAAIATLAGEARPGTPLASPANVPTPRSDILVDDEDRRPQRRLSLAALAAVVVAFGLVLFVGFQYVDYQRGEGAKSGADAVSAPPLPAASQPAAPIAAPAAPPGKGMEHANGFSVRLRDSSWVWVQVDGKVVMEGSYPKGTQRTFAGRSATIRVGNAGGVDIGVDGKDLGPMGGLGDVAERSFQL